MKRYPIVVSAVACSLCQLEPEHDLNPDTSRMYLNDRLHVEPELVYSSWATEPHLKMAG